MECTCKSVAAMALGALGLVGAAGCAGGQAGSMGAVKAERADCPGKIVCPVSGKVICADQCPLGSKTGDSAPAGR